MKRALIYPVLILLVVRIEAPGVCAPISKFVDYMRDEEPMRVELHKGLGTSISFDAVNETIETMFLDNKSFVSLHTNGCIADIGIRNSCPPNSAPTLVHLSIIDDINLTGVTNTNREAGNISMLTLVTSDSRKQKHNYVVNIKTVERPEITPHVALVRVKSRPVYIPPNIALTTPEKIEYLKAGFRLATFRGDYKLNFFRYNSLQKFITALATGEKLQSATDYDLSLVLISDLVKLGTPVK